MFYSLKYSFSVQIINPASGRIMSWSSITDEVALLKYLKKIEGCIFIVAGMDYAGNARMVTHKYCERIVWGFQAFGMGLKKRFSAKE